MPPISQSLRPARPRWMLALLLAGVVAFVFFPANRLPFISLDDADYVSDNAHVRAGLTWAGVKWAFTTTHACNWHPFTWLSLMADVEGFGPGPLGPHFTNLFLHVTNAALLFLLLHSLTGAIWRSVSVAALFALHPLRVESVAWVSERKDVLCATFFLLTLYCYFNYARSARTKTYWYSCALASFTLGLLSKPMIVTLPFVLMMADAWPLGRASWRRPLIREKIPFFVLSAASCFATFYAQQQGGAISTLSNISLGFRLENAAVAIDRYLGLTLYPADLGIYYPLPNHWGATLWISALLLIVAISILAGWQVKTRPFISFGWFWFFGMLIPVLGIVQVGSQSMADRYTYLPSIGLFIALVWGVGNLTEHHKQIQRAGAVLLTAALLVLSVHTRLQLRHWSSSETLFRHTLAITRNNFVAHYNLGSSLLQLSRADEAIDEFEKALMLNPNYAEAHVDLGNALLLKQRSAEAISHYREAIKANPSLGTAHYNLGTTLLQLGQTDNAIDSLTRATSLQRESALPALNLGTAYLQKNDLPHAIQYYEEAAALQPDLADAHSNLGFTLQQIGQPERARLHLEIALKISPQHAFALFHLGNLMLQQGRAADAVSLFKRSIEANPYDIDNHNALAFAFLQQHQIAKAIRQFEHSLKFQPDSLPALSSLSWIFATSPEAKFRDGPRAVSLAEQALRIAGTVHPQLFQNLAAAKAENGRFADAVSLAQKARTLAATANDVALANALESQIASYEAGAPFRDNSLTSPP